MWKPGWIFLCNACGSVKEFTVSAEYWRGNCPGFFACFYLLCWPFNIRSRACLKKAFCKMCVTICGRFCPDEGAVKAFCKMCVTICGRFCPDEGAVAGYGN